MLSLTDQQFLVQLVSYAGGMLAAVLIVLYVLYRFVTALEQGVSELGWYIRNRFKKKESV